MANNRPEKTVVANGQAVIFTDKHQSLLECLESENIEVHYHCRDGFCGACRIQLNQGQINYPQGEPLAFVGDNEILPCCCVPETDITVTID
ncbi:class I ribonucleotide reductase maintenance protein YfaE [Colwellia sp. MEBiC06753]